MVSGLPNGRSFRVGTGNNIIFLHSDTPRIWGSENDRQRWGLSRYGTSTPYTSLEEAGSGISSLWARTTALKRDCTVAVGYAEKVDGEYPTTPEYYNSALIVNRNDDTVGNYRSTYTTAFTAWDPETSQSYRY